MADLVMGAMGNLVPKLYQLLEKEYKLQTGVKERISSLTKELELAQAVLRKVAEVPWDQLDEQVQIWARELRKSSYDMEDVVDTFLVHVQGPDSAEHEESFVKRLKKIFKNTKARRKITCDVKDIMSHLQEVTERCARYKVQDIVAMPAKSSLIDPRLHAMYNKVQDLVGIDESSGELISKLQPLQRDDTTNLKMKIVSVVGVGGLGKTTLAKAVYNQLTGDFSFGAFVPVGRNPDLKKVLKDILLDLDKQRRLELSAAVLDERQLIDELCQFLKDKRRYFIVIDDIWEIPSWEQIKLAFGNNNSCGARIVITTRNQEVAEKADEVYKLQPLPVDISRVLFFTRISDHEGKLVNSKQDEVTIKFLKRCAGIPLAIITMASLLAGKPRHKWDELYRSIGFRSEDNDQSHNTMRIVSFSYYDLPAHLRTCLLYLSAFPEDSFIPKQSLVWMWVAEGFVEKKHGTSLFETGEGCFHELVNRSMLEAVEGCTNRHSWNVTGCRVHDMVLDFIRSMSQQENFFSVVLGNDQGTPLETNNVPRRQAHHNRTMRHGCGLGDDLKMEKVRSLFAIGCGVEVLDPFHGFTLLRVLVLDNNRDAFDGSSLDFRSEHLKNLLHLRFLSISGTYIKRIPEEVGCLRFLQTLDLHESSLGELPSPGTLPEQLVRLCLPWSGTGFCIRGAMSCWLTRLTSLEELSLTIVDDSHGVTVREFWECVRHFNKLEHLTVYIPNGNVKVFVLPSHLRHLVVRVSLREGLTKLPSCVNVSCLPNLSFLEISLVDLDEHDMKMLGMLSELRFLVLRLWASAKVSSAVVVIDKDASEVYFPRLQCCQLRNAMVSCYANEEDKSVSFHVWAFGKPEMETTMPSICMDKSQRPSTGAPCNRFMPFLKVLRICKRDNNNLIWDDYIQGFEYAFPSLREIGADIKNDKIMAALRSAAEAHPNRPAFRKWEWGR